MILRLAPQNHRPACQASGRRFYWNSHNTLWCLIRECQPARAVKIERAVGSATTGPAKGPGVHRCRVRTFSRTIPTVHFSRIYPAKRRQDHSQRIPLVAGHDYKPLPSVVKQTGQQLSAHNRLPTCFPPSQRNSLRCKGFHQTSWTARSGGEVTASTAAQMMGGGSGHPARMARHASRSVAPVVFTSSRTTIRPASDRQRSRVNRPRRLGPIDPATFLAR